LSGGPKPSPGGKGKGIERRSPNRPKFVAGWRKTIGCDSAEATLDTAAQQIDCIDIWLAHPDSLLRAHSCLKLLTEQDWGSLGRIRDTAVRHSAMAARVLLRLGLSRAVDHQIAPSEWQFRTTARGKPVVADTLPEIKFSVSHVDQLAVVAICPHLEIGVDVESVDQNVSEDVVSGFSHLDEQIPLRGLLPRQKIREFIRLWTFKEAYTKMVGAGHSLKFDTINFLLDPVTLESTGQDRKKPSPMQFESIYVSVEHSLYHVSLAIERQEGRDLPTEVRIISLAEPKGVRGSSCVPVGN